MTYEERLKITQELFDECIGLGKAKGADYASKGDTLANFKETAKAVGLTKYEVWAVFMDKQYRAIMNSIKASPNAPQPQSEPIRERIKDIIVYATLLEALIQEDENTKQS